MSRSLFSLEVEVTRWLVGPNTPPPGYDQGPCVQHLSSPAVSPELDKPTRQRVRQRASRQLSMSSFMFWGEAGKLELIAAAEREGTLFPRVKGSIVLFITWNKKHPGPEVLAARTGLTWRQCQCLWMDSSWALGKSSRMVLL